MPPHDRLLASRGPQLTRASGFGCGRVLNSRSIQSSGNRGKRRSRTLPAQLLHILKEQNIGSKRSQLSEQHCIIPVANERVSESTRVDHVHVPFTEVLWDGFKVNELGKHCSR